MLLVTTLLVFISTLSRLPDRLNGFTDLMSALGAIHPAALERLSAVAMRRTFAILAAFVPVAVGMAAVSHVVLLHHAESLPGDWRAACSVLIGLTYLSLLFPVPPCAAVFLISFGFSSCTRVVSDYASYIRDALGTSGGIIVETEGSPEHPRRSPEARGPPRSPPNMGAIMSRGANVARVLEKAQLAFSRLAFDECAASLLFGIVGSYLSFSVMMSVYEADTELLLWLLFTDLVGMEITLFILGGPSITLSAFSLSPT